MTDSETKGPLSPRERDRVRGELLKDRSRALRKNATDAERHLWRYLRARNLAGVKFRRQVVIDPYIIDFLAVEQRVIVEVDGGQHSHQCYYDVIRSDRLKRMGYTVLRFWNHDVLNDTDVVLAQIMVALENGVEYQGDPAQSDNRG